MSDARAWIEERRAIHAKATPGKWEEDAVSGLEGCVYLADGSYECVADAMSTDDAGPIVDAHNMFPRALDALEQVLELHTFDYEHVACGNPQHTNFEVGCPDCYLTCPACGEPCPCLTVQTIEGAINE